MNKMLHIIFFTCKISTSISFLQVCYEKDSPSKTKKSNVA